MQLLDRTSLGRTVEAIDAALFEGARIPKTERQELAGFVASRQGQPRSYRGLFAPTDIDFARPLTLFTGEKVSSRAGTAHILGEEAYRALLLLDVRSPAVAAALARAPITMAHIIRQPELDKRGPGVFCCGSCSVALWRCLAAGGYGGNPSFLRHGLATLQNWRDGKGRWGIFPYWYTVLALTAMDSKPALTELRYSAALLERAAKRRAGDDSYSQRRKVLAERALAKC